MGQFLSELKRRKVIKVAIAYVIAAWALLEAADLLASILELPGWTAKLVLALLLIGFIPALILAWAYDLTPDGIEATTDSDESGQQAGKPAGSSNFFAAVLAVVVIAVGAAGTGFWYLGKDSRWVRDVGMPSLDASVAVGDFESAFALAVQVEEISPDEGALAESWPTFAWKTSIISKPAGALIRRRAYDDVDGEWQELGTTPLHDIYIPFGASLITMELEGHVPMVRIIGGGLLYGVDLPIEEKPVAGFMNVHPEIYQLDSGDSMPAGMVRVPGWDAVVDDEIAEYRSYFLGRYEVTNQEFQAFVDAGGYERPDLWEHEFVLDGAPVSFEKAIDRFKDSTGRLGPASWEAGTYAQGHGNYPVSGVSWYEAAAYARFAGHELPTVHHWSRALSMGTLGWQLPASNLGGEGVVAVGKFQGVGWTGTYDMAGNVREWCFNATRDGRRVILGSSWTEADYMVEASVRAPHRMVAFDRSATNGFRLASTSDDMVLMKLASAPVASPPDPVFPEPVSDEVFAANLSDYDYERTPLNPVVEEEANFRHWTRYRITIDSPDGAERIPLYLYLPERRSSRYQTIMFWPGGASMFLDSIEQSRVRFGFALRNGRAVVMPVMVGTYGRRITPFPGVEGIKGRNLAIQQIQEFRRVIDYLETRPDIDSESLAYSGHSWGARIGATVLSVEPRFKLAILNQAGINNAVHHDINAVHFLPRVNVPVLQFNGRFDTDFIFERDAKPFFDRLATKSEDKKLIVSPTGHFVAPAVVMGETLDWLDTYQGPVR